MIPLINKRTHFLLFALVLSVGFTYPHLSHAEDSSGLTITEVMYDVPGANTGRQWIEVENTGSTAINLSSKTMRLFTESSGAAVSKDHLIKPYAESSAVLATGDVAVIAANPEKFLVDWPNYSGVLLKSAFSLTSAGTVGFLTTGTVGAADQIIESVTYSSTEGAMGDGNSLQRSSADTATLKTGAPTPGIVPAVIPAALKPKVKQLSSSKSISKSTKATSRKTKKTVTSKTYDKGTLAPADSADAASAGALDALGSDLPAFAFSMPAFLTSYVPLFSSVWFAAFVALIGFSAFSLLVLQRQYIYDGTRI